MTVAGAGVEEGVTTEQGGLITVTEETDVRHRVPWGIEALELEGTPDAYDITLAQASVDAPNATGCAGVREYLRPGRPYKPFVAPGVVEVLVRVEDLGNGPALLARRVQA
jgi:hypothetical protein